MPSYQPTGLGISTTRPFPTSFEVALLGDSRNAQNHASTAAPTQQLFGAARGYGRWAQSLTRGAIQFPADLNFAVSGTLPVDIVTGNPSPAQNAASSRAGMVIIHTGTNAFNQGGTAAGQIGYITMAMKLCVAAGKMVGVFAETPRGNSGTPGNRLSATNLLQQQQYRDWVRRKSGARSISPLVFVIDTWPDIADQTYNLTTGDILSAPTYDTTHMNIDGAYITALRFLQSIGWSAGNPAALYLPQFFLLETACDLFDVTNNPTGNLLANGMLGGTGGGNSVSGFGVSGTFPTSWSATQANSGWQSGSPTLVGSQQTNARGNWWQAALGGTTGSMSNPAAAITQTLTLANLAAGDVLRMAADFEVDASSSGFTCPFIELQASLPAGASNTVRDFAPSDGDTWGPTGLYQGTMLTPPLTIAGAETAVTARLWLQPLKSSSLFAAVRFRKIRVWKET
jgi:hypothetical protein